MQKHEQTSTERNICKHCTNFRQKPLNREGVVTHIDDAGQIHGTWGGCAIVPEVDTYIIVKRA